MLLLVVLGTLLAGATLSNAQGDRRSGFPHGYGKSGQGLKGVDAACDVNSTTSSPGLVAASWYAGWMSDTLPPSAVSWSKYTHMTFSFAYASLPLINHFPCHNLLTVLRPRT